MKRISRQASTALLLLIFAFNTMANDKVFRVTDLKYQASKKGEEFISGTTYQNNMMKVKLIGEVQKPGVHILPEKSNFTSLLSYAGGPTKDADIADIKIKRKIRKNKYRNIKLNFKDFMENSQKDFVLRPNDVIYVKKEAEFFNTKTLAVLGTILGAIVSGIVINDRLRK